MPEALTLPSFAKVNLSLRVLGRRDDGFHEIRTIFQSISLHDTLEFHESDELTLECDDPSIPTGKDNLVIRAAERLQAAYGVELGARILLSKRIPSPGGLAGGSSNAAVTLLALNKLWGVGTTIDRLKELGNDLGSDIAFFFEGGTACGSGRGSELDPMDDAKVGSMVVITTSDEIAAARAYSMLNAPTLTKTEPDNILTNYCSDAVDGNLMVNDLEKAVFPAFPEVERAKWFLERSGAVSALMSGSGSSVFGIFDNEEKRQTAMKALGEKANWRSFAVTAVSRSEYREALSKVL